MKAHSIHMVFSPQSCSLDLLESTLTEDRRRLADQLLKQIKSDINRRTASHTLIVGPRGSGKTHILAFVRKTIEASWDSAHELLVMPLAEEEHGLTTLLDFVLVALRSCGHDIRVLNSQFGSRGPEVARADAIKAFDEVSAGRAVLIPVENLSTILAALEPGEVDRLRAFLQSHSRVALLASSVELFEDSSRPDHPFHGFFGIEPLRPLSRKDARIFLAELAKSKGDAELEAEMRRCRARPRINAIYDLTGGNHRLLAMLSAFLSVDGFADLVGPFVQMVDRELTPYYQQRLDRLSPQQRKILMAIANHHGRALSVNEIARYVFSTSQVVSRQLADLLCGAYVRRTRVGKESLYELNEPLLRLVLDIKEGRDRPLPLIVGFLRRWYHLRELQQLARDAPETVKRYYATAIELAISTAESRVDKKREMTAAMESLYSERPEYKSKAAEGDSDYFSSALRLAKEGHLDEAIAAYDEIVLRFGESERPDLQIQVAMALVNKGFTLGQLNRSEDAVAAYDEVVKRFGASKRPELLKQVAMALFSKGVTLNELDRSEDAIAAYDEIVNRFGESGQAELLKLIARAMFNKGDTLAQLNRAGEAIAVYDEIVNRFGVSVHPELLNQVARALVNKGVTLGQLNRSGEAIAVYDDLVDRFSTSGQPELSDHLARALAAKASIELENGRLLEGLALSERALSFVSNHPAALQARLRALFRLGNVTRGIEYIRGLLSTIGPEDAMRSGLVTWVLEEKNGDAVVLGMLVDLYQETPEPLSLGLLAWIQQQLPVSETTARLLEKSEQALAQSFGRIPTCSLALQLLTVVRRDAMGDRKALLQLPLEIRRLVSPMPN